MVSFNLKSALGLHEEYAKQQTKPEKFTYRISTLLGPTKFLKSLFYTQIGLNDQKNHPFKSSFNTASKYHGIICIKIWSRFDF